MNKPYKPLRKNRNLKPTSFENLLSSDTHHAAKPDSIWVRRKTSLLWYIRWVTERGRTPLKYTPCDLFEARLLDSLIRDGDVILLESTAHNKTIYHLNYNLQIRPSIKETTNDTSTHERPSNTA